MAQITVTQLSIGGYSIQEGTTTPRYVPEIGYDTKSDGTIHLESRNIIALTGDYAFGEWTVVDSSAVSTTGFTDAVSVINALESIGAGFNGGAGTSVPTLPTADHIFPDEAARDAHFIANPTELLLNTPIFVGNQTLPGGGTGVELQIWAAADATSYDPTDPVNDDDNWASGGFVGATAAQIKVLYESNPDTNALTDALLALINSLNNVTDGRIPLKSGSAYANSSLQETNDEVQSDKPIRAESFITGTNSLEFEDSSIISATTQTLLLTDVSRGDLHSMIFERFTDIDGSSAAVWRKKSSITTLDFQLLSDSNSGDFSFTSPVPTEEDQLLRRLVIIPNQVGNGTFSLKYNDVNGRIIQSETVFTVLAGDVGNEKQIELSNPIDLNVNDVVFAEYSGVELRGHIYSSDPTFGTGFFPYVKAMFLPVTELFLETIQQERVEITSSITITSSNINDYLGKLLYVPSTYTSDDDIIITISENVNISYFDVLNMTNTAGLLVRTLGNERISGENDIRFDNFNSGRIRFIADDIYQLVFDNTDVDMVDNFVNSIVLSVTGNTLRATLAYNGQLTDIFGETQLPSVSGTMDGVVNSISVGYNNLNLEVDLGRTEGLSDLSVEFPFRAVGWVGTNAAEFVDGLEVVAAGVDSQGKPQIRVIAAQTAPSLGTFTSSGTPSEFNDLINSNDWDSDYKDHLFVFDEDVNRDLKLVDLRTDAVNAGEGIWVVNTVETPVNTQRVISFLQTQGFAGIISVPNGAWSGMVQNTVYRFQASSDKSSWIVRDDTHMFPEYSGSGASGQTGQEAMTTTAQAQDFSYADGLFNPSLNGDEAEIVTPLVHKRRKDGSNTTSVSISSLVVPTAGTDGQVSFESHVEDEDALIAFFNENDDSDITTIAQVNSILASFEGNTNGFTVYEHSFQLLADAMTVQSLLSTGSSTTRRITVDNSESVGTGTRFVVGRTVRASLGTDLPPGDYVISAVDNTADSGGSGRKYIEITVPVGTGTSASSDGVISPVVFGKLLQEATHSNDALTFVLQYGSVSGFTPAQYEVPADIVTALNSVNFNQPDYVDGDVRTQSSDKNEKRIVFEDDAIVVTEYVNGTAQTPVYYRPEYSLELEQNTGQLQLPADTSTYTFVYDTVDNESTMIFETDAANNRFRIIHGDGRLELDGHTIMKFNGDVPSVTIDPTETSDIIINQTDLVPSGHVSLRLIKESDSSVVIEEDYSLLRIKSGTSGSGFRYINHLDWSWHIDIEENEWYHFDVDGIDGSFAGDSEDYFQEGFHVHIKFKGSHTH